MTGFDALSPQAVITGVESAFDLRLEGLVTPYNSYVNRVYGLEDSDGRSYVAKFYRPGRWNDDAIEEEHRFTAELAGEEVPVVPPLADADGDTLARLEIRHSSGTAEYRFALFPKRSGRLFDSESEDAWRRIGALCGRIHSVGSRRDTRFRTRIAPDFSTLNQVRELEAANLLPGDMKNEILDLVHGVLERIIPMFDGIRAIRIHGDLHRGNILNRDEEGLLLIDLDDMAFGPAVQDLWLLLPGRRHEVGRELGLLAEGYEDFRPFPWELLPLIEPLRFMRMIHFIAWCARQRRDRDFGTHFPHWGTRGWWVRELEDLRDQARIIEAGG